MSGNNVNYSSKSLVKEKLSYSDFLVLVKQLWIQPGDLFDT